MAGFDNDVMYANNADFSVAGAGSGSAANGLQTNGQMWIGTTVPNAGGTRINVGTLTSPDSSVTIGYSSPNVTLQVAGGTTTGKTITGNTGGALAPTAGNWNIPGNNNALNGFASYSTGSGSTLTMNSFGSHKWVVNPTAGLGTHTTIQAAITAASAGDTVVITAKSTPYVENITAKVGVNVVADTADAFTPNVVISGTFTHNTAGTVCVSGIRFQTNAAAAIAVTGTVDSVLIMRDCYINCTNATGITFSSSSAGAGVLLQNCDGNLATTGIGIFAHSSPGAMMLDHINFTNTGASTTASTCSSGIINMQFYNIQSAVTTSGTALGTWEHGLIDTNAINITSMTVGSGTGISMKWARLTAGTASAASIAGIATFEHITVASSNTNAITGAGTLNYSLISFNGSSSTVNVTTQNPLIVGPKISTPGITFDNNVNTLSIFQQGTFSPVVVGNGVAGAPVMTQQFARYQKVGRVVTINMWVTWGALGGATGSPTINNLPYTVQNSTGSFAPSFLATNSALALTTNAQAYMQPFSNTVTASIVQSVGGAATAPTLPAITATNGFTTVLTYETA